MKKGSSYFTYDGINSQSFNLVVSPNERGLYKEKIIGNREVREEKIEGRPAPYFFALEELPLDFSMSFAFIDDGKIKSQYFGEL